MKSEDVKQLATNAIETLAAALAAGKSEDLKRYLAAMARFHRYSLHNLMLIALQKPTASHVAGFHTWKKLGRFVRKGEKAIFILAPMVRMKENMEVEEQHENRVLLGFRARGVFDYSQTEGCELPSIGRVAGDPSQYQERLIKFVAAQRIAIAYDQAICPARGISEGGKITLLPGMTPAENFATLVHELAHELLHRADRARTTKCQRETEAEAVAFVVCHAIGLETGTASQDYIQLYNGDAKLLLERLERVRSAASQILDGIGG
jgi:N-terminal domain of anti-restriction factor ArdC